MRPSGNRCRLPGPHIAWPALRACYSLWPAEVLQPGNKCRRRRLDNIMVDLDNEGYVKAITLIDFGIAVHAPSPSAPARRTGFTCAFGFVGFRVRVS